jgi:hypothetical protein
VSTLNTMVTDFENDVVTCLWNVWNRYIYLSAGGRDHIPVDFIQKNDDGKGDQIKSWFAQ